MIKIGTIIVLIISYAAAAMLSSNVSMDLTQTNWLSLWTYFWWAMSLPVIGVIAFLLTCAAIGIWERLQ